MAVTFSMFRSEMFPARDMERFYDYPPILSEIKEKDLWRQNRIQLYVHIPFCLKKCNYCPYFKEIYSKKKAVRYIQALKREIKHYYDNLYLSNCCIEVIYIGGGTPGCLPEDLLIQLLDKIREGFRIDNNAQITMELNPTASSREKLSLIQSWGVNRVSFGVQTFDDDLLKLLGRSHDGQHALQAVYDARDTGFEHINIDLLFRIPGQTLMNFESDIHQAVSLPIDHISLFGLNIKPNTRLYEMRRTLPESPSTQLELELLDAGTELLGAAGFKRYSIDALCKDGCKNRYSPYNREVLGIGAGAFSHINHSEYNNYLDVDEYIHQTKTGLPIHLGKKLTPREEWERYLVYAVFNLRVDKKEFSDRFGINIMDVAENKIKRLISDDLIAEAEDAFVVTNKGFFYIFNISKYFFSERYQLLTELL